DDDLVLRVVLLDELQHAVGARLDTDQQFRESDLRQAREEFFALASQVVDAAAHFELNTERILLQQFDELFDATLVAKEVVVVEEDRFHAVRFAEVFDLVVDALRGDPSIAAEVRHREIAVAATERAASAA